MWTVCNQHATEVVENVCPHCGEHLVMNKKSFANHVRWCKENPKYQEIRNRTIEKIKKRAEENLNEKRGELKKFTVYCAKCGKPFEVEEREKEFPLKEKYYCSRSCANTHKRTEESKKKTSESLKRYARSKGLNVTDDIFKEDRTCPVCGKTFHAKNIKQITCSSLCSRKFRSLTALTNSLKNITDNVEMGKLMLKIYRQQCAFKFPLNDYPEEFEFQLIKENGWYKAKNHGNNLYGVSRDHIFSMLEGFKQQIDPYYISHPANCKLLLQSENSSKRSDCGMTIEALKNKINKWNEKYGVYENKINYELLKKLGYNIKKTF